MKENIVDEKKNLHIMLIALHATPAIHLYLPEKYSNTKIFTCFSFSLYPICASFSALRSPRGVQYLRKIKKY